MRDNTVFRCLKNRVISHAGLDDLQLCLYISALLDLLFSRCGLGVCSCWQWTWRTDPHAHTPYTRSYLHCPFHGFKSATLKQPAGDDVLHQQPTGQQQGREDSLVV